MTLTFSIFITNEGILATRQAQQNPGWYIIPYQFRVSDTNRGVNATRTYASIDSSPWYSGAYSALNTPSNQNKIIHNVVVPPTITGVSSAKNYGEIYFIYKNHNGQELLYAIGAPSEELTYTPGVAQKFYFSFSLNNVQVADIIQITDTSAQDIEDHNISPNAHTIALASYQLLSQKNTANGYCPLDSNAKVPLSNLYNPLTTAGDIIVAGAQGVQTRLPLGNAGEFLTTNGTNVSWGQAVPVGSIIAIPHSTVPSGYLECDGSSLLRSQYAQLFTIIGTTYGSADETHFNLPNFQAAFLRGAGSQTVNGTTYTANAIGTIQQDEFKAHTHSIESFNNAHQHGPTYDTVYAGQRYTTSTGSTGGSETRPLNHSVKWIIKY